MLYFSGTDVDAFGNSAQQQHGAWLHQVFISSSPAPHRPASARSTPLRPDRPALFRPHDQPHPTRRESYLLCSATASTSQIVFTNSVAQRGIFTSLLPETYHQPTVISKCCKYNSPLDRKPESINTETHITLKWAAAAVSKRMSVIGM